MNSLTDLKFLIVDDFATLRAIVRGLLKELGSAQTDEAEDGLVALRLLKTRPYDLVLTDINMPNLNGFELLKAIKSDPSLCHLPVLMVMAEARREDIVMAVDNGAAGYIVKPFGKLALAQKLRKALHQVPATA